MSAADPNANLVARDTSASGGPRLDRFGALASGLCAVHCAVAAALPTAFGVLGLGALLGHEAEWGFTVIAVAFGGAALVLGWRRHRSGLVASLLLSGIMGLLASRGLEVSGIHGGAMLGVLAGALLVFGHLLNINTHRRYQEARGA